MGIRTRREPIPVDTLEGSSSVCSSVACSRLATEYESLGMASTVKTRTHQISSIFETYLAIVPALVHELNKGFDKLDEEVDSGEHD